MLYLLPEELDNLLTEKIELPGSLINQRRQLFLARIKPTKIKLIYGHPVKLALAQYRATNIDPNIRQFKGIVAAKGPRPSVIGRVKFLRSPQDSAKMIMGDILVAELTSPDYIMAIKRAGAIITDAGGLTSHAAVVSRELNIPCLVNTKFATKLLKDGDLVEINVEYGVIKKII